MHDPDRPYRLYGRRKDRPLSARQALLMEQLLPRVRAPDFGDSIDPRALFPGAREVWFEIGFGGGEHMAAQARANPDIGVIGAEPFINGVAKALVAMDEGGIENIRIHHGDARPFLAAMSARSLARVFVLHPDPWPKTRHHKRRLINEGFLADVANALRPGGELRVASDIADYVRWTLVRIARSTAFDWTAESAEDWRCRPVDWPATRYEAKAEAAGRACAYLRFIRR